MNDTSPIAFVAGATGYTGQEVVRALCESGVRTIAHLRHDSSRADHWTATFEALGAEVDRTAWEDEAMTRTLQSLRPTTVFALLGTTRKRAQADGLGASEAYEQIDYGLTALLLRAAARAESRPRFVYLSAAGASPSTRNPYMKARGKVEAELRASGLPFCIVRPSFITGPDRAENRPGERFGAAIGDAVLGVAGALGARRTRDRYASITARALAQGMVRHALRPTADDAVLYSDDLRAPS